jgi:predicted  nucleic acid-binding Zn-ribbon protein
LWDIGRPQQRTDPSPNPLLAHLDEQINELKTELAAVYRTQAASQNKQLTLSDALRDRDEEVRGLREEVRDLREARDSGVRRERDWEDRWKARTKDMEVGRLNAHRGQGH